MLTKHEVREIDGKASLWCLFIDFMNLIPYNVLQLKPPVIYLSGSVHQGHSNEYPKHAYGERGYSNSYPQHNSNYYPQHMYLWRNVENHPYIIKYSPYLFLCVCVSDPDAILQCPNITEDVTRPTTLVTACVVCFRSWRYPAVSRLHRGFYPHHHTCNNLCCVFQILALSCSVQTSRRMLPTPPYL